MQVNWDYTEAFRMRKLQLSKFRSSVSHELNPYEPPTEPSKIIEMPVQSIRPAPQVSGKIAIAILLAALTVTSLILI